MLNIRVKVLIHINAIWNLEVVFRIRPSAWFLMFVFPPAWSEERQGKFICSEERQGKFL